MRAVVQRVSQARVISEGTESGAIGKGFCVLLGVEAGDTEKDAVYMADKIRKLRVFEDENEKMNLSLSQVDGSVLLVSQFTLLGDARGQNRPGFTQAEAPERANDLYQRVCARMRDKGLTVEQGIFRADMQVALVNDGPVTILLDSEKQFLCPRCTLTRCRLVPCKPTATSSPARAATTWSSSIPATTCTRLPMPSAAGTLMACSSLTRTLTIFSACPPWRMPPSTCTKATLPP